MPRALSDRDLLARLVAFDTTSGRSTGAIASFIESYVDGAGIRAERRPGSGDDRENLVLWCGPPVDPERRDGLMLSGHLDVVPAGDGWRSEPFTLVERDGALHGRGACDMKGFVAVALNALRETAARRPRRPLVVVLSTDEELGSLGAKRLVDEWPADAALPTDAIVGEPTSLRVVRLHKGHLKLRAVVHGRAAHSGQPHLGENAVVRAAAAIAALDRLRAALAEERVATSAHFPETPFTALNVATIRGGTALNVVPARCELGIGLRPLPGESSAPLVGRVREALAAALPDGRWTVEITGDSPPLLVPADARVRARLAALAGQPADRDEGVSFSSDAAHLQRLGVQAVLFGPGDMAVAHRPDEHVPIEELDRAHAILTALIGQACLAEVGT